MPLCIEKKTYNLQSPIAVVIASIKTIPAPVVVPFDSNIDIKPEAIVRYKQREMAIIQHSKTNLEQYLGTADSLNCITIHIRNKNGEYGGIHIDGSASSKVALNELIDNFKIKEGLEITLMGGLPGKSEELLALIIQTLLARTENITLIAQRIIERNVLTQAAKPLLIRDEILKKGKLLFEKMFPHQTLDLTPFTKYKTSLFDKPNSAVTEPETQRSLMLMLHAIAMMTELLSDEFYKIIHTPGNMTVLMQRVNTPEKFKQLFQLIFCKNIYNWLISNFEKTNFFANKSGLPNFAFNLNTGEVHELSSHMPTRYEIEREIYYYRRPLANEQHNYFMCYQNNAYVKPVFSPENYLFIEKYSKYLERPYIPKQELLKLTASHDDVVFSALKAWANRLQRVIDTCTPLTTDTLWQYQGKSIAVLKFHPIKDKLKKENKDIEKMEIFFPPSDPVLDNIKLLITTKDRVKKIYCFAHLNDFQTVFDILKERPEVVIEYAFAKANNEVTKINDEELLKKVETHLSQTQYANKKTMFLINEISHPKLSSTAEALVILQEAYRTQSELVVICSENYPLVNKEIAKAIGFSPTINTLTPEKLAVYILEPMKKEMRYAKLVKQAKLRNPQGSSLDFAMSANPHSDFKLLLEKNYQLNNVQQLDLSWSMLQETQVNELLSLLKIHTPNLKRIVVSTQEKWYDIFKEQIKQSGAYILFGRNDQWTANELPAMRPDKAKLCLYTQLPVKQIHPQLPSDGININNNNQRKNKS